MDQIQTSDAFHPDTSGTAMALRKAMDLKFCLHLVALSRILTVISIPSKHPQGKGMDISTAAPLEKELSLLRIDEVFLEMWDKAETVASKINVEWGKEGAERFQRDWMTSGKIRDRCGKRKRRLIFTLQLTFNYCLKLDRRHR